MIAKRTAAAVTALALAGLPAVSVTQAFAASKAKAGQACSVKKKAPTGFKCKKNKKGKYTLVKG